MGAKSFGAWPASQVAMSDDLPPSIWPGPKRVPPFGYIKIKMAGQPDTKGYQIPFVNMKMHMRYLSPDEMKVKTAITPLGLRYYLQSDNWTQYEYDYKEFKAAISAKRKERFMGMLSEEIIRTKGKPKPSVDLFS
jgi:hypothetical protein